MVGCRSEGTAFAGTSIAQHSLHVWLSFDSLVLAEHELLDDHHGIREETIEGHFDNITGENFWNALHAWYLFWFSLIRKAFQIANLIREYMEVIKAQMLKDAAPPVAPHAPAHGLSQPATLIAPNNNNVELRKGPRPSSGILRHSGLAAPS